MPKPSKKTSFATRSPITTIKPSGRPASFPVLVEIPPLERVKIKKNAPFIFTATVEIKPTIELRDYKAPNPISLKPDKRTVTDEQIDQALEALREQHAQLDAAPPGSTLTRRGLCSARYRGVSWMGTPLEGATKEGHLHKVGRKCLRARLGHR